MKASNQPYGAGAAGSVRIVLLDLGGVLVDLGGIPDLQGWMRDGADEHEVWRRWLTSPAVVGYETGRIGTDEFVSAAIAEMRLHVSPAEFRAALAGWVRPFPGAAALLADLGRRYTLGCLSNTNDVHWTELDAAFEFERHFRHLFPSHRTGRLKPERAAYTEAVRAMGCAPAEVLFLDDREANVHAAQGAGLRAMRAVGLDGVRAALAAFGLAAGEGA
jgi:glucose-1-phosphatase